MPVVMFSFLGLGVLIIFFNYVGWMPGGTSNSILLLGLGSVSYTHLTLPTNREV